MAVMTTLRSRENAYSGCQAITTAVAAMRKFKFLTRETMSRQYLSLRASIAGLPSGAGIKPAIWPLDKRRISFLATYYLSLATCHAILPRRKCAISSATSPRQAYGLDQFMKGDAAIFHIFQLPPRRKSRFRPRKSSCRTRPPPFLGYARRRRVEWCRAHRDISMTAGHAGSVSDTATVKRRGRDCR